MNVSLSELLITYILIHIISSVFVFGVLLAYFDRYKMKYYVPNEESVRRVSIALLGCVFCGPFSVIGACIYTCFPRYGFKLWTGEIITENNKWFSQKMDLAHSYERVQCSPERRYTMNFTSPVVREVHLDGCISFWKHV